MVQVEHSVMYIDWDKLVDSSRFRSDTIKVRSVSASISDVYLDRPVDYNIEYGDEEHKVRHKDDYILVKYSRDMYISVRTNCWAKINVDVRVGQGDSFDTYTRTIYQSFSPFDYEDGSRAILSRINLEGEIPVVDKCIDTVQESYVEGEICELQLEQRLEKVMD